MSQAENVNGGSAQPGPAPRRPVVIRAAGAAISGTGRFLRGFVRQSLYLNLYLACLIGLLVLLFQIPKVKEGFKNKVAHIQEKYLSGGGNAKPVPADIQDRLDGMESTLQSNLTDIRLAVSHANVGAGMIGSIIAWHLNTVLERDDIVIADRINHPAQWQR